MAYYRIDMDGKDGEHLAIFADANADGTIFQQFCVGMDNTGLDDLEHLRLTTVFGVDNKPLERVSEKHGWRRISGDEWNAATWLKLTVYERDEALRRQTTHLPCGKCGGKGRLMSTDTLCPDCKGTGKIS